MTRVIALLLGAAAALVVVGCSSSATPPSAAGGATGPLLVEGAWARAAVAGGDSAAYFTIVNGGAADDTLIGASSDVALKTEVHQTTTDANGMTGMRATPSLTIPGGGSVDFAPGGYHVMLTDLKQALSAGDQVPITLTFQNAGVIIVMAAVRAN
jgi:copper(I)-binding protein